MRKTTRLTVIAASMLALGGCDSLLDVTNVDNPETERVLATPADVEALIRDSYTQALNPLLRSDGINMQLGSVAFENSAMAANFGMIERSQFPRIAIINTISDQFSVDYYEVWRESYAAIRSASDGLAAMGEPGFTLGSAINDARARAFGKFVLGFAHAVLAITYDQAAIYDETIRPDEVIEMTPYEDVMAAALGFMEEAVDIATANPTMSFPVDWMGVALTQAQFVRIVNSFKARYRTQVARNPDERQNDVDWDAVIADVDAGITTDYAVVDDDNLFDFWMHDYMSFRGAWHQVPYMIHGMADTSGAYQAWISTATGSRTPFVIQSPDKRFPQGTTLTAQRTAPGLYYRAKTNDTGEGGWIRAERGTWRWSHYIDKRYQDYYDASNVGEPLPIIRRSEMNLIKAEALLRTGDAAGAAALINLTREANGGLPPVTAAGVPAANSCVPKLPSGQCGDLLEALKWEKRLEHFMTVFGGWFFDARGWGDLAQCTAIHYPVPARELEVRQLPLYTFGGTGPGGAPLGTYGIKCDGNR